MIMLECNGVSQSLEGWGIERAVLRLVSLAIDTFTFDVSVQDAFADPAFAFHDVINVYSDGVRVFSGQITKTPVMGSAAREAQSYVASGPWYYLSRIVYKQKRLVYNGVIIAPEIVDSSRVMLFMGTGITDPRNSAAMVEGAINYGVNVFHIPIQFGGTDLSLQAPMTEVRDVTCADVIIFTAKWTPDAVAWFDYSVDPPAFYCKRRSSLTAVEIDPINTTENLVTNWKIQARPDLQVAGVLFTFEQTIVVEGVQKVALTSQTAGDVSGIDVITHTFTLQGLTEDTPELPPPSLATLYFNAVSELQWEGEIEIAEQDCSFIIGPGNAMNFAATCPARFQTMKALVQQVQYDLVNGITSVSFGPPSQLGPQDFVTLLNSSRGITPGTNLATSGSTSGGDGDSTAGPTPKPFPGSGDQPFPTIELELCNGSRVHVVGSP